MSEPAETGTVRVDDAQVNLYVQDIERSLRFYRDDLGFGETFRTPKNGPPDHVELALGPFRLGLATFAALERYHGVRTRPGPPRAEIALFTEDPDAAYGWAVSRGAPTLSRPHDFGGYVRSATVADPDGNPVVFTHRLPVSVPGDTSVRPAFSNHLYNLYTARIDVSLPFYRELLGGTETFRTPKTGAPDHVELELGRLNVAVSTLEALKRDHGISAGGGPPRGEVVLWVRDLGAALRTLSAVGAPVLSPPHDFAGTLRGAWIADPDGNPVQLVARSTRA